MDKGRATNLICLDFCKAFNMAPHNIATKLERHGCDKCTFRWIWNKLDGHICKLTVSGSMAKWKIVPNAVSQGSILEPLLFNISLSGIDSGNEVCV